MAALEFQDIIYQKHHRVQGAAWVSINRPEVMNSFTGRTLAEMKEAVIDANCDESIGVVVVTGLLHLGINEGMIYQVSRGVDGAWEATKWRALPGGPESSGLLKNGDLLVKCSLGGSVEISPQGNMRMAGEQDE